MAIITLFNTLPSDIWDGKHDTQTHVFKAAFFPSTTAMADTDSTPEFADYAGELSGGDIPAGGVTLASFQASNTNVDFADNVIAANASNPSTARKLLIYNDTTAGKPAIGFVDYGSDQDLAPGGTIAPAVGGFITMSV